MPNKPGHPKSSASGSKTLAARSADLMLDKKAKEITILDVRLLTSVTDFFVLCTGESDVQIKAIVDHVNESLRAENTKPYHIEGYDQLSWVLMDYVDVVAHIFLPETREYYGLERLWADAKISTVSDEDA
ncbi:MAG: ribosome silencing factor [Fidelibacterota bacterium]|nr:MAG: ribosome silencing factor [Candidatus Neomarinimicrobiota bacterium]